LHITKRLLHSAKVWSSICLQSSGWGERTSPGYFSLFIHPVSEMRMEAFSALGSSCDFCGGLCFPVETVGSTSLWRPGAETASLDLLWLYEGQMTLLDDATVSKFAGLKRIWLHCVRL
jgi:hypothetical protein